MTAAAFRKWMAEHGLTIERAAELLGYKPRQVVNFRSGACAIPMRTGLTIAQVTAQLPKPARRRS